MSSKATPPPSADNSQKQQLTERSEDSEYEDISQEEGFGSPLVIPYAIDKEFSFSSPRPLKITRAQEESTTQKPTEQPKSTTSAPSSQHHSQEQVAQQERDTGQHQPVVIAGPSNTAAAAAAGNTFSSTTPPIHREGANRQDDQASTPKFSSLYQASLPNNQQATMSPHSRANLSQQMNYPVEALNPLQQPIAPSSDSTNPQQQQPQQGASHHHHVNVRIFIVQRRPSPAISLFIYYLLNVLKICFFASILYNLYNKDVVPLSSYNSREKLYVLKRI